MNNIKKRISICQGISDVGMYFMYFLEKILPPLTEVGAIAHYGRITTEYALSSFAVYIRNASRPSKA